MPQKGEDFNCDLTGVAVLRKSPRRFARKGVLLRRGDMTR
jgi:hypothetical protein